MDTITKQYVKPIANEYAKQSLCVPEEEVTRTILRDRVALLNRTIVIADVGCGSGLDLQAYSAMGFTKLFGIEPSDSFRGIASDLLGHKACIIGGAFQNIPLKNVSVGALVSRYSMHYCRDVPLAIKESARVIKTGGSFLAIIPSPDYDNQKVQNHNGDGTISHTLFGGTVPIRYPLHAMAEYTGTHFQWYFDLVETIPLSSPTLDGVKPGEVSALCLVATRNARPVADCRFPQP